MDFARRIVKRWKGKIEASLLSRLADAIESNMLGGNALNRFACLVLLPPKSDQDFYRGGGCRVIITMVQGLAAQKRRKEFMKKEFTFLCAFLTVKTNITNARLDRSADQLAVR